MARSGRYTAATSQVRVMGYSVTTPPTSGIADPPPEFGGTVLLVEVADALHRRDSVI